MFEVFWLITAVLGLGAAIHKSIFAGIRESALFILITIIAFVMFMIRRSIRKREKSE